MRNRNTALGIMAGLLALALPAGIFFTHRDEDRSAVPPAAPAPSIGYRSLAGGPGDGGRTSIGTKHQVGALAERESKRKLMESDVALTNELCRSQCRLDLGNMIAGLKDTRRSDILTRMKKMREEHPHMDRLQWIDGKRKSTGAATGSVPGEIKSEAERHLRLAAAAIRRGQPYESGALQGKDSGETYFVIGVPHKDGKDGGVAALIHQDILGKVKRHQMRNLRLTPYPDERKRFGIRAFDPHSGKEVDVDTAEENQGISHYRLNEVVVRFTNDPSPERIEQIRKEIGAIEMKKSGYAYVFESKEKTTKQLLDYFRKHDIMYAEPHYLYVTNEKDVSALSAQPIVPNDDLYSRYQWNLPMIGTPTGWELSKGNEQVTVAVIDTGVDLSHPDLQGHLLDGHNIIDPSKPPEDDVGHGTHVAGVIAALTDNGEGIAGMTWYNRIMPVKVLDSTGMGSTYAVAEGIIWATDHGAKVINMSLGNYASAQFLKDAVQYAFDRDVVLIAATGNDNTSQPGYPAAYDEVFGVSATNVNREKASFSNWGDYVDVVAPGENIASTYMGHQYAALSGTSMASPHTTALAALIRSVNPKLKNTEVYDIMRRSAVDLGTAGRDPYFGYGQIDVAGALQLATGQAVTPDKPNKAAPEIAEDQGAARRTINGGESLLNWLLRFFGR